MAPTKRQRLLAVAGLLLYKIKLENRLKPSVKKVWVKPHLLNRSLISTEDNLLSELLDVGGDFQCVMTCDQFMELHQKVQHLLQKNDTVMRDAISSKLRLAITLRYLASGDSYRSLEYLSRVSRTTIGNFVPDVCTAIYEVLQPDVLTVPQDEKDWENIATEFDNKWQFPHVIGALDGIHISVKAPANEGAFYYNYKGFYSVVLLALVDANYHFLYIDCGCNGRVSGEGVYRNSSLYSALNFNQSLNIPQPKSLSGRSIAVPYCVIGNDAFELSPNLMVPYPTNGYVTEKQTVFNYRLSRVRRLVENAFGILAARFRIFHRPMDTQIETTETVVKCCCVLHNYLRTDEILDKESFVPPDVTTVLHKEEGQFDGCSSMAGCDVRDEFADYFTNEGEQVFQWNNFL